MSGTGNEKLGVIDCETCGKECGVYQAKRKGAHLYTRCSGGCGLDQRNGAIVQSRLFFGSRWLEGARVSQPSNADKSLFEQPKSNAVLTESVTVKEEEITVDDSVNSVELPTENKPKGLFFILAAALAGGVILWKA